MKSKIELIASLPSWIVFIVLMVPYVGGAHIDYGLILVISVFFAWLLIIGISIHEHVLSELKGSNKLFIFCLIYAFLYISINTILSLKISKYLVPPHLLAVFCVFYAIYFVSKLLALAEEKKTVGLSRYIGTIFLFWFFPIGVWFIQPRVRKILKNRMGS